MNAVSSPTSSALQAELLSDTSRENNLGRILVVDDQPANIQIIGAMLGKLGHDIIPAADGISALKRVALRMPDLILLDLLMPNMGGVEVCLKLKENPEWKDIPVIFLSAADDKDCIIRALNAGGVDYITKPFNQAELLSRVRTQLALKFTQDRLKQLAEDKDELVGILTHDLKNYLGGINMSSELLRNHSSRFNDQRLTLLSENISRSSSMALAFVKQFLANSASEHGLVIKPASIDFTNAAKSVVQQYAETARRKHIDIQTDIPNEPIMVLADPYALDQVLDNLLSNAIKFSPENKKILVTLRSTDGFGECVIRDQGPGFTEEDKSKMFRRYGRLSARPTGGESSTGLGLSIVQKLVRTMAGELLCESVPENGATFTVRFPVSA